MNKNDIASTMAEGAGISKAAASKALDSMITAITNALRSGDRVTIPGFGSFQTRHSAARTGRNPATGETIKIKASNRPTFKAGKSLKDAVN